MCVCSLCMEVCLNGEERERERKEEQETGKSKEERSGEGTKQVEMEGSGKRRNGKCSEEARGEEGRNTNCDRLEGELEEGYRN